MDNVSVFGMWKKYFQKLEFFGLNIVEFPELTSKYEKSPATSCSIEPIWRTFLRIMVYFIHLAYFVFCLVRMTFYFMEDNTAAVTRAACSVWILFTVTGIGPVLVFAFKYKEINQFMKAWAALDLKLSADMLSENDPRQTPNVPFWDLIASEKRGFKMIRWMILTSLILDTFTVGFNAYGVPRMPLYLSSLVPPESMQLWHRLLSIAFQSYFVMVTNILRSQLFAFSSAVAGTLGFYLKCITPVLVPDLYEIGETTFSGGKYDRRNENLNFQYVEKYIDFFMIVKKLMNKFNRIFSWAVAAQKCLLVIFTTALIFVFIRKRPGTPWFVMVVFIWAAFTQLSRTYITGLHWARLYTASSNFSTNWTELITFKKTEFNAYDEALIEKLKACTPFGICIGNMYVSRPRTLLTYASVVTTYLIVVLQIKG